MNNDSSWEHGGESPLDRAIDRAVREMMHVDPPAGLRRRVLSRLQPSVTRRPLFLPRHVFAAVAIAILVVVAMFMRDPGGSRVETQPSVASSTQPRVQPVPAPAPQPAKDSRISARGAPITRERIRMPRVANVFGTETSRVSAAADAGSDAVWTGDSGDPKGALSNPVAPLVVAPLMPPAIETPPIVIPPLVIPGPPKGGV
jgi:hypothetical protein